MMSLLTNLSRNELYIEIWTEMIEIEIVADVSFSFPTKNFNDVEQIVASHQDGISFSE